MKIDIFPHIMPPEYIAALEEKLLPNVFMPYHNVHKIFPALADLKQRFIMMDKFHDVVQVLTLSISFVVKRHREILLSCAARPMHHSVGPRSTVPSL